MTNSLFDLQAARPRLGHRTLGARAALISARVPIAEPGPDRPIAAAQCALQGPVVSSRWLSRQSLGC
jgi:hypothetical protein